MLHEINLLPWREALQKQRKQRLLSRFILAVALSVFSLFVMGFYLERQVRTQSERLSQLDRYLVNLNDELDPLYSVEDEVKMRISKLNYIQEKQRDRGVTTILINQLIVLIPDGVYIDKMSRQGSIVDLIGISEGSQQLEKLLNRLESSPFFSNVQFNAIGASNLKVNPFFQTFTLTFRFNVSSLFDAAGKGS